MRLGDFLAFYDAAIDVLKAEKEAREAQKE